MPQMLNYCGRILRIANVGGSMCVNGPDESYLGRVEDSFLMQIPDRCDGRDHGDCQLSCQFMWRSAWFKKADSRQKSMPGGRQSDERQSNCSVKLRRRLQALCSRVESTNEQFHCQATQLYQIAPKQSSLQLGQYVDAIGRNGVSIGAVAQYFVRTGLKKLLGSPVRGQCQGKTPTNKFALSIGDRVKVKSIEQINATLDQNGCNRGLWFDPDEMARYCGKELVVSRVIERVVDERSGRLRRPTGTVVLSEAKCSGVFKRFCSRGLFHFWRTIWLEPTQQDRIVEPTADKQVEAKKLDPAST